MKINKDDQLAISRATKLLKKRRELGLSIQHVAKKLAVSGKTIRNAEDVLNPKQVSDVSILKIARFYYGEQSNSTDLYL